MTDVGASWGNRGAPLSFCPEGRTYSPPGRRPGGGSLPVGQAARSARRMRLLREPTANAAETAVLVIIVCAEGAVHLSLSLRKPAPSSFIAEAGHPNSLACFLFCERETEKHGGESDWQYTTWKRRSSAEARADLLAQHRPI